ncbi:hypothetical protein CAOG_01795 [Capsaspora owczarzaki ATCC 30864]|uniref:Transmembrane protein n=1 Tax=Capsaspora owczarzaki (strain ATCC 30864) TaxID=595528 RepID=A0A0D2WK01_CAPO3|nr:hypothetical protein CAOG_01795 [Capsaspora owczarzaki ATCC 30864]KJE90485.1 hypothetical protein CAOG_001795 [Capsaspora owczarzaki ATCC 30864]|eukprot:XP_004364663.1 hypothetical protein CAOG_01795 [Capsaspora owczarzaki ATCC 30864]
MVQTQGVDFIALPLTHRILLYGLMGWVDEVVFTALSDIVFPPSLEVHPGYKRYAFVGYSSLWSFFIYAIASLYLEFVYSKLIQRRFPWLLRGLTYMLGIFTIEFVAGLLLWPFGANSWDYSHAPCHVWGMIRCDYSIVWFTVGLGHELVIEYLFNLHLQATPRDSHHSFSQKLVEFLSTGHKLATPTPKAEILLTEEQQLELLQAEQVESKKTL